MSLKQWLPHLSSAPFKVQLSKVFKVPNTVLYPACITKCKGKSKEGSFPSPFYILILGPAMKGALIFMVLGWLFHISLIFFKIVCPILALKSEAYFKWIHLCLLGVGEARLVVYFVMCENTQFFTTEWLILLSFIQKLLFQP